MPRRRRLSNLGLLLLVVLERMAAPAVGAVYPAVRRMPEVLLADGRHAGVNANERHGGWRQAGTRKQATRDVLRASRRTGRGRRAGGTNPVEVVARALAVEGGHGTRTERVVIGP